MIARYNLLHGEADRLKPPPIKESRSPSDATGDHSLSAFLKVVFYQSRFNILGPKIANTI